MQYRTFGTTGIELSEIAFGAMRATGDAAHVARSAPPSRAQVEQQNAAGRRALALALEAGVNCIHSSDDYGTWWLLDEVLRSHPSRHEVHHVIKMRTPDYEEEHFDPHRVREGVEHALRSLHAERITFVQHLQRGPNVSEADAYSAAGDARRIGALDHIAEQFAEIMDVLQTEGMVGYGVTWPHTIPYARHALTLDAYAGVVHFMNLLETEALSILDDLAARGKGFLGIRPLLQGMLTDKRIDRTRLEPGDPKLAPAWNTRYAVLDRIRAELGEPETSWTTFSTQFALTHPAVTSVVVSANDEAQMVELLNVSRGDYPPMEVVDRVDRLVRAAGDLPKSDLFVSYDH